MNIGAYTFVEFRQLAENFHGYAAPGLLIGGYMLALAKENIPEGTLFEAVVETRKCLPDAVQLLTPCSTGNNWMKVINLGRYAVSLFDKSTGEGVRVSLSLEKLKEYPEIYSWFMKNKAKAEQDSLQLEKEIRTAGPNICKVEAVKIKKQFLGKHSMTAIGSCPICSEAYPLSDGAICRGCQGEAPYRLLNLEIKQTFKPKVVPVQEAVGKKAAHDMTRIEGAVFKGPEFKAGQRISASDLCRLQQMGRFYLAVDEGEESSGDFIHENEVAEIFAKRMAGRGITYDCPASEGKIDFVAEYDGLFTVNVDRLKEFNMIPDVMAASRQDATVVSKGSKLAGTRSIPLYLNKELLGEALAVLGSNKLFSVEPLRKAKIAVLVTGTEVFQGIIEDKFIPIMEAKAKQYNCEIIKSIIVKDDVNDIKEAIESIRKTDVDMLITTGGLSVDPDDVSRQALLEAGLTNLVHGVPVLPGAMSVVGIIPGDPDIQVLGVPACALYYKTTFFDLAFPRLLAGREITRVEVARMAEGAYCMSCKICTYPKCWFGK